MSLQGIPASVASTIKLRSKDGETKQASSSWSIWSPARQERIGAYSTAELQTTSSGSIHSDSLLLMGPASTSTTNTPSKESTLAVSSIDNAPIHDSSLHAHLIYSIETSSRTDGDSFHCTNCNSLLILVFEECGWFCIFVAKHLKPGASVNSFVQRNFTSQSSSNDSKISNFQSSEKHGESKVQGSGRPRTRVVRRSPRK